MSFRAWLENEEGDFRFFSDLLAAKLDLNPKSGLSTPIDSYNKENLKNILSGLGEFKSLPIDVQNMVLSRIETGLGTLGDLIRLMASKHRGLNTV